ncbi:MAG TPA: hypothetical protein VGP17_07700 [Solirubrobacteraceae bacterium]|jgi:hypothetical protein|nr:hypothetical protein [Solirubrobacteraceae bacterium]
MFAIKDVGVLGLLAGLSFEWLVVLAVACWVFRLSLRIWSRLRLAEQGVWFEVLLAEETSRETLEGFLRTLAHGLPRRWVRVSPWVMLGVYGDEQRAVCALFVSGGLPAAQVRAALEQALGGASVQAIEAPPLDVRKMVVGRHRFAGGVRHSGSPFLPLRADHKIDPAGQLLAGLAAQARGEGGAIQVFIQAPSRSMRGRALRAANRLRSGDGLESSRALWLIKAAGAVAAGIIDAVADTEPQTQSEPRKASAFEVEQARAIERKAKEPLLAVSVRMGAWAIGHRRAYGRLSGLNAALGQYRELSGLHGSIETFAWRKLAESLPPLRPRLLLSTSETAGLLAQRGLTDPVRRRSLAPGRPRGRGPNERATAGQGQPRRIRAAHLRAAKGAASAHAGDGTNRPWQEHPAFERDVGGHPCRYRRHGARPHRRADRADPAPHPGRPRGQDRPA